MKQWQKDPRESMTLRQQSGVMTRASSLTRSRSVVFWHCMLPACWKWKSPEAGKQEHLTDDVPHAFASSSNGNPTSPTLVIPLKHSRVVVMGGKPQKRAVRRREWSWDTAAANTDLGSSQMLPKELYHRPFTKMWLELETSSLYIT